MTKSIRTLKTIVEYSDGTTELIHLTHPDVDRKTENDQFFSSILPSPHPGMCIEVRTSYRLLRLGGPNLENNSSTS